MSADGNAHPSADERSVSIQPAVAGDSALHRSVERWSFPPLFRPAVGPIPFTVARVSGPDDVLHTAAEGLPEGAAKAEAIAVRLRRLGFDLRIGAPALDGDPRSFIRLARERGVSSVEIVREDPSLLAELQIGAWFDAGVRMRALRRVLARRPFSLGGLRSPAALGLAADIAFWSGVRSASTAREWRHLTTSSYVCLYYHRLAGERKPGQERLDVSPRKFERQLRLLRRLGFQPLAPDEQIRFHEDPTAVLPRRSYVLTVDDAFADAVAVLSAYGSHRPQLFVPTGAVGREAPWSHQEPIADWAELQALASVGTVFGSHGSTHTPLTELDEAALDGELTSSRATLETRLSSVVPFLAYPHGRHDTTVRSTAHGAGYRLAYTTNPGKNGAGTDPYCLRRIGIKDWDSALTLLWKAVTGEHVPELWMRLRVARRDPTSPGRRE